MTIDQSLKSLFNEKIAKNRIEIRQSRKTGLDASRSVPIEKTGNQSEKQDNHVPNIDVWKLPCRTLMSPRVKSFAIYDQMRDIVPEKFRRAA
jgi:hypothetical protein